MTPDIQILYKDGKPSKIIFLGKVANFKLKSNDKKSAYCAGVSTGEDEVDFIHDASCILAVFVSDFESPLLFFSQEKKNNSNYSGLSNLIKK
jgi:hypothetical protein